MTCAHHENIKTDIKKLYSLDYELSDKVEAMQSNVNCHEIKNKDGDSINCGDLRDYQRISVKFSTSNTCGSLHAEKIEPDDPYCDYDTEELLDMLPGQIECNNYHSRLQIIKTDNKWRISYEHIDDIILLPHIVFTGELRLVAIKMVEWLKEKGLSEGC